MGNFNRPEGQTTSDNFLKSEIEKDFLRAQSGWGELSEEELAYLGKKGLKTPADLLRSYRELERAYSSKVSLPKDGDKKGFDKLYSRLGMPHDCTGFDICFADEDREDGEAFKQVCLENHILPQSAQALYDWYVKHRDELLERDEQTWQENSQRELEEMKRVWGTRAQRNFELMKRGAAHVLRRYGPGAGNRARHRHPAPDGNVLQARRSNLRGQSGQLRQAPRRRRLGYGAIFQGNV